MGAPTAFALQFGPGTGESSGGEMAALIRAFDWSRTPIGDRQSWSPALRTMVQILLANRFPMLLWWGPEYISIYNDAYCPVLGRKHPWGLGRPVRECWSEIWDVLKPLIDTPFHGGNSTWIEDLELQIDRSGFTEEAHFTVAYSPVPDETALGGIGGVLATVHETTQQIVGERRIVVLRDLGARAAEAKTAEEACAIAADTLSKHGKDIPFALFYLIDNTGHRARLAAAAGLSAGARLSPEVIELEREDGAAPWPLGSVRETEQVRIVEDLAREDVPAGPWPEPPDAAAVLPIRSNLAHQLFGFLVTGVSSRLRLDESYRDFLQLATTQIATAIANARAYDEERRRAEALAEIDRAKTVFFSNVSHEFRTPLTLMMGPLAEVLAENSSLAPRDREQIATAHRNSLRLLKLVNSLLDFSRIEAGRVKAIYAPADLAALTADLASNFRSTMEAAGLQLIVECAPLPEPVYVDREMWEKIVLNLLSNAFKFTFEGSVTVRLEARQGRAELTVADTGVGIPEAELPRIFERFHRVEATRGRTYEGTGIGLALIQEFVKLHGGTIEVSSRTGAGTTFAVALPFGSAHLPPDRVKQTAAATPSTILQAFTGETDSWLARPAGPPAHPAEQTPGARPRILLADDNADMREYIARVLGADYDLTAVGDGAAALQQARENTPDLVVTDVMMPGLDGFELLEELRNDPRLRGVPVIVVSARAGEEARTEGIGAGADDYLTKPFSAGELAARVRTTLDLQRVRRQARAQFETLIDQAPVGIYLVDADFRIRHVNPTALPVFGNLPNLIGRDFEEVMRILWTQPYADEVIRRFRHTLETGEPDIQPERIEQRQDRGVTEYYEWRIDRIPLPDGRFGVVCYFRDISAQIKAREELRRANRDLEQFAYSASHDLQEPLRTVKVYSELLDARYGGNLDARATEYLHYLRASATRMETLVHDLLAYAQAPLLDKPAEPVAAGECLREAMANLAQSIEENKAKVDAAELPAVRVHPTHLRQLFQNLIGNAIKYRREDTTPEVRIAAREQHGSWLFSVCDNGIGIEPEYRERIFELFKRLHTEREYSGNGIGLALCSRIVEHYHGRIGVESEPGRGSEFYFTLPA